MMSALKSGAIRALGITGQDENKLLPGIKTFESQGYKVYAVVTRGYVGLAGTPKEIVDVLSGSLKKVAAIEEFQKRAEEAGLALRYMGIPEYTAHWEDIDQQAKLMIEEAKAEQAKK
jgi:tripartite-type tricarboxylate transporter receptor subunit TctC